MATGGDDLPRFEEWKRRFSGPAGIWDYAAREGGVTLALAFASLFWPRLIEVEGCILLRERYDPGAFEQWRERLGDQHQAVERTVNHIHLWDWFDPASEDVQEEQVDRLAEVLGETWRAAFAAQFPDRVGEVVVAHGEPGVGPIITLFTRV